MMKRTYISGAKKAASAIFASILLLSSLLSFGGCGKEEVGDDSDVLELISAYMNAQSGYTKYPENDSEAYALVYEKLRSMPYERVNLEGDKQLVLNSVSGSLTDREKKNLEECLNQSVDDINSSSEKLYVDYGEDVTPYIPDISGMSPVNTVTEISENGEYVVTFSLSKSDSEKLTDEEDKDIFEKVKTESLNEDISVKSAASSVKDGTLRITYDVDNFYISGIETEVSYYINLDCEFAGKLKGLEAQNILLEITSRRNMASAREGIYFTDKKISLSENESLQHGYEIKVSPSFTSDDYQIGIESMDAGLVAVDGSGTITALKTTEEPVTVYVYLDITGGNSYKDSCEVNVTVPVRKIKLSLSELTLKVNNTAALSAEIAPENAADRDIVWLSVDEAVAAVSEDGIVTATGEGKTKIVALSPGSGVYAVCGVTVN